MPKKTLRKIKYQLVYAGRCWKEAEAACDIFWESATTAQKFQGVNDLIEHVALIKGTKNNELRLCRSTAVIKRTAS